MLNAPALSIANNLTLPRVGVVAFASALVAIIVVVLLITPTTGAG